jgi:hypothetical protein
VRRRACAGGGPRGSAWLAGPHEHENLETTLEKLLVHGPGEEYEVIVKVARDLFESHAREQEEAEILPAMAQLLAVSERVALAEELRAEQHRIQDQIRRLVGIFARAA